MKPVPPDGGPATTSPWLRRLGAAWTHRTYTVVFAATLTLTGAMAVVFGDRVSAALSNLAVDVVSRGMGAAMLAGGLATLAGVLTGRTLWEMLGMALMATGAAVYGLGVVLGLGLAGMVAGPLGVAIAVGTVGRVVAILRFAGATRRRAG